MMMMTCFCRMIGQRKTPEPLSEISAKQTSHMWQAGFEPALNRLETLLNGIAQY